MKPTLLLLCILLPLNCSLANNVLLILSAYEVLSDEKKRRQYDQFGSEGMNDNGFNFHQGGFKSFDDLFQDFDFGFGSGQGNGFKFSFEGGFDDFFGNDDEDEEEDDFFDGFKFGGFGDSFFGEENFHNSRHREDLYASDRGDRVHRNVRHEEFRQTSKYMKKNWITINSCVIWVK